jgi:hypothetical protein
MITATRMVPAKDGSTVVWFTFGPPSETYNGQPCELISPEVLERGGELVDDLAAVLDLFGYRYVTTLPRPIDVPSDVEISTQVWMRIRQQQRRRRRGEQCQHLIGQRSSWLG